MTGGDRSHLSRQRLDQNIRGPHAGFDHIHVRVRSRRNKPRRHLDHLSPDHGVAIQSQDNQQTNRVPCYCRTVWDQAATDRRVSNDGGHRELIDGKNQQASSGASAGAMSRQHALLSQSCQDTPSSNSSRVSTTRFPGAMVAVFETKAMRPFVARHTSADPFKGRFQEVHDER